VVLARPEAPTVAEVRLPALARPGLLVEPIGERPAGVELRQQLGERVERAMLAVARS
jgi:hypothetical protein